MITVVLLFISRKNNSKLILLGMWLNMVRKILMDGGMRQMECRPSMVDFKEPSSLKKSQWFALKMCLNTVSKTVKFEPLNFVSPQKEFFFQSFRFVKCQHNLLDFMKLLDSWKRFCRFYYMELNEIVASSSLTGKFSNYF